MTDTGGKPLKVMLVAAEASGDALGAGLARVLRARLGADVTFVGVGGVRMAEQGVESPFDIAQLSILGILESLKAYPRAMARFFYEFGIQPVTMVERYNQGVVGVYLPRETADDPHVTQLLTLIRDQVNRLGERIATF